MKHFFTAGEVAAAAGVNKETIRFYENKGLLPEPEYAANGYRQYNRESIQRINFIKTAQSLGFSLEEIRGLLELAIKEGERCQEIHRLAEMKMRLIRNKITELKRMEAALAEFSNQCKQNNEIAECHFVHTLWGLEGENHE